MNTCWKTIVNLHGFLILKLVQNVEVVSIKEEQNFYGCTLFPLIFSGGHVRMCRVISMQMLTICAVGKHYRLLHLWSSWQRSQRSRKSGSGR